ncbi:MAG: universal stress protein [Chloroflexota bacterium]
MSQLKRIIIGHDLRGGGEAALRSAAAVAGKCGAKLRLVHVMEPRHFYYRVSYPLAEHHRPEKNAERAGVKLEELATSRELEPQRVEYEVRTGKPFVEVILAARAWRADLIVIGGPTRQQGHLLGSTGERMMRKAPVPVLVSRKPLCASADRLLVPTDFSAAAVKAAKEALALAAMFRARILFLHVLDSTPVYTYDYENAIVPSLVIPPVRPEDIEGDWEAFLANLSLEKIGWEKLTEEGRPADKIIDHAAAVKADLIVMGTHGRSGLAHMFLGSVAEEVARGAPCPVLTIRPEAFQFEAP